MRDIKAILVLTEGLLDLQWPCCLEVQYTDKQDLKRGEEKEALSVD
jgi:hypothetical protein